MSLVDVAWQVVLELSASPEVSLQTSLQASPQTSGGSSGNAGGTSRNADDSPRDGVCIGGGPGVGYDAGHGDAGHGNAAGHGVTPDAEEERGGVTECDMRLEDLGEVVRRVLRLPTRLGILPHRMTRVTLHRSRPL